MKHVCAQECAFNGAFKAEVGTHRLKRTAGGTCDDGGGHSISNPGLLCQGWRRTAPLAPCLQATKSSAHVLG